MPRKILSQKRYDRFISMITKHGGCGTRIYNIHLDMIRRCEKPNSSSYSFYGGRGISVCHEWKDFEAFREWAISNGYSEFLTIDRINNDGNYHPDNCRWVSRTIQARNSGIRKDNKTGISGVPFDKQRMKYRPSIAVNGKSSSLGQYDDFFEACCARKSAENRLWK